MLTMIVVALALIAVAAVGIYLLLRSMGEDGIEAAAPGSCRSGRCGVRPADSRGTEGTEDFPALQHIPVESISRTGQPRREID